MTFKSQSLTPAHNKDFISLIDELNVSLGNITGDSGESSFVADDFDLSRDGCIVVYVGNKAVACGVFRFHSGQTCELKRMYSKVPGAGSFLLNELEDLAASKGYVGAVLSTRRVNERAVKFYQRNGFKEIEAYGKYMGLERSICMGKPIVGFHH
ncbi:Acetyltransferase (GNAT) family protein [Grimontia celer]|uniref:Acetyltransferase (GNAT) family protein n=1 Tax=Grimontia celer TaxID=1796497 RepID=A0A128EV18_9GAMM|nr:GNAT family N-acetyltransferase [Grimontia celer]CZF78428.1 Acetyltransferase (GNAT) family protein [Grimontia celer]